VGHQTVSRRAVGTITHSQGRRIASTRPLDPRRSIGGSELSTSFPLRSPLEYAPLIRLCDSWSRVFPEWRLLQIGILAATSATSAASFRKLFLPLFFTGVFPKLPAVLASLTYPRASVFYGSRCHCPWRKDSQVLQSLLTPQVAISPVVYHWSQYGEYGIRG